MKYKAKAKEIKNAYTYQIVIPYSYFQNMLRLREPSAYTEGKYGHNADIYEITPRVCIVTGARPFGNIYPPIELIKEYERRAREKIELPVYNPYLKKQLDSMLMEFINKAIAR